MEPEREHKPVTVRYTNDGARGTVEVAGHDISKTVSRFTFDHNTKGDLPFPQVFLELRQGVALEPIVAEAVVFVRETVLEDPADAMLRFIEPLDPSEFEKACLAAMDMGGPSTFGEAALHVLRGYAGGGS